MACVRRLAGCWVAIALLCWTGELVAQRSSTGTTSSVRSLVSRYVTALQRRDYGAIVQLNFDVRLGEASIMIENPKFLWPKLIAEYRTRKAQELKIEEDSGSIYIGDYYRTDVNEQLSLLRPECKWVVSELRPGRDRVGHLYTEIFVTVTYPVRENSPEDAKGQFFQGTVLKFVVLALDNNAVQYSGRVVAGDVLWSAAPSDGKRRTAEETVSPTAVEPNGIQLNPPPPESTPRPSGTFGIRGGVSAPKLILSVEPEYSPEARKAKFQGTVVLSATVGVDGIPRDIKVARPLGMGLDERAIECVSKWRYAPALRDGQAVPSRVTLEVSFRLL